MSSLRRPSPALVIAVVALFVAASGGAWAASGGPSKNPRASAATKGKRGPRGPRGLQGPRGPSDGFIKRVPAATSLPPGADTTVVQLSLTPGRSYIVTAATELGNNGGPANLVSCTLLENFNPIGAGSANLPGLAAFAQTITLTSATTGGNIKLSCSPTTGAQARNSVITAVQVGALHAQ